MKRDHYECQECRRLGKYHRVENVHHIKEVKDRPDLALDLDNLICLCVEHHNEVHGRYLTALDKQEKKIESFANFDASEGGKCMIINDNGREYDTEKIEEYSSYTQGLIKRLIYVRYVGIRDLLSDNCCSKYKVNQVREALNKDNNVERIKIFLDIALKRLIITLTSLKLSFRW